MHLFRHTCFDGWTKLGFLGLSGPHKLVFDSPPTFSVNFHQRFGTAHWQPQVVLLRELWHQAKAWNTNISNCIPDYKLFTMARQINKKINNTKNYNTLSLYHLFLPLCITTYPYHLYYHISFPLFTTTYPYHFVGAEKCSLFRRHPSPGSCRCSGRSWTFPSQCSWPP